MMTRGFALIALSVAALAIPQQARGHEGHVHKLMGTVSIRHENHLELKSTDGRISTITLDDKTRIRRGKLEVKADDIKTGERVVVSAIETRNKDGKTMLIAKEIRLAAAAVASK